MPIVRLGPLLDKMVSLKVELGKHIPAQSIAGVIHEALLLDEETRTLTDMLPDSWRYHAMPQHTTPPWAYQGLAHQYPEHRAARHWNVLRLTRLFMNEVVWHFAKFVARAKE